MVDISIDNLSDEGLVRLWEAVMEQVAKDYIDYYICYLRYGPDANKKAIFSTKYLNCYEEIVKLEDYIVGDLIAGPHAEYIIKKLREEAEEHVKDGRVRRKEIIRRG